jgi:hypothetical protein
MKLMAKSVLLFALLLCAGNAVAQSLEKDHVAVLELGGARFWSIKDGALPGTGK